MKNKKQIELDITIVVPAGTTNRELDKLRAALYTEMEKDLSGEAVEMYQEAASRSVDPAIIGTISLVLLPIVVDKVADSLIKLIPSRDCSVKLSVPIGDLPPATITYDPRTTSPDKLKSWIDSIRQSLSVEEVSKGGEP
ncbi:MAG: hypothetical protein ACOYYS_18785 [Chloroflexota bacterium]